MFIFGVFTMKRLKPFSGDLLPLIIYNVTLYRSDMSENSNIGEHMGV